MRIDFVEITPKHSKTKKVVIVILVILFIALFGILGMYYAKLYNFNIMEIIEGNNIDKDQEENNIVIENTEEKEDSLLPVYTEEAKNKMKDIYNENTKIAYLTFDDGPSRAVTPLILDVLKEQNIKATFFVLGNNVVKNPDILRRAYLEGHYIANHGYTHKYEEIYMNASNVLEEYNRTEEAIQQAIGNNKYSSHLFRFPGGYSGKNYSNIKKQAAKLLNKNDISYIDWNSLTRDAVGANTREQIIENIKESTKNKGNIVVLMHDASSKILTYETLNDVINYLRNKGYTFDNFYSIMK